MPVILTVDSKKRDEFGSQTSIKYFVNESDAYKDMVMQLTEFTEDYPAPFEAEVTFTSVGVTVWYPRGGDIDYFEAFINEFNPNEDSTLFFKDAF